MDDYRWPKLGDKAFTGEGAGSLCQLNLPWEQVRRRSETFKIAGDMVVASLERSERYGNRDDLFFPIAYLYRQALELKLKNLVRLGTLLCDARSDAIQKALGNHKLVPLWKIVRSLLLRHASKQDRSPLDVAERVIQEFHDADPGGDAFRYETDRDDRPHANVKLPRYVDLGPLRSTFDGVFNFLDCCETEFEVSLDRLAEEEMMRREHLGL